MPKRQSELTPDEQAIVGRSLAEYLTHSLDFGPHDEFYTTPIVAGELRHSKSGAPWACFGDTCFRLMDMPDAEGGWSFVAVLDDDGRPLGRGMESANPGILLLGSHQKGDTCFVSNTGWNKAHEIRWKEEF